MQPLILLKPLMLRPRHGPRSTSWIHQTAPACRAGAPVLGTEDPHNSQSHLYCTARSYSQRYRWGKCRLHLHKVRKRGKPVHLERLVRGYSRWAQDLDYRRCGHHGRVLVARVSEKQTRRERGEGSEDIRILQPVTAAPEQEQEIGTEKPST